jgi:uncharacterized protein YbaA (DUF1428 family)
MAKYVDGFLIPIPTKNLAAYRTMAKKACKVWMDHGALDYVEALGDDLEVPMGVAFTKQLQAKKGETVVFSYIVYRSRSHRDAVNKKVMADPRIHAMMESKKMPFDAGRMCYGGFKSIVEA